MIWLGLFVVFIIIAFVSVLHDKTMEDTYERAYKLGYEMGMQAQKEKDLKAIDEFEKRLKGGKE